MCCSTCTPTNAAGGLSNAATEGIAGPRPMDGACCDSCTGFRGSSDWGYLSSQDWGTSSVAFLMWDDSSKGVGRDTSGGSSSDICSDWLFCLTGTWEDKFIHSKVLFLTSKLLIFVWLILYYVCKSMYMDQPLLSPHQVFPHVLAKHSVPPHCHGRPSTWQEYKVAITCTLHTLHSLFPWNLTCTCSCIGWADGELGMLLPSPTKFSFLADGTPLWKSMPME